MGKHSLNGYIVTKEDSVTYVGAAVEKEKLDVLLQLASSLTRCSPAVAIIFMVEDSLLTMASTSPGRAVLDFSLDCRL